jgi:hypothetical protein
MVLLVALGALAGRRAGVTGWPLGLVTLAPLALLHGTAPLVPVEQHFAPPIRIARS